MDDLARELGMSKKTIYQYVENKEDLVNKAFEAHMETSSIEVHEIFNNSELDAMNQLVVAARTHSTLLRKINPSALFDLKKYYKSCWKALQIHQEEIIYNYIYKNIEEGIEQGLYRKNLNKEIVTSFYVEQMKSMTENTSPHFQKHKLAEVYIEFLYYHVHGIASDKGIAHFNKIIEDVRENQDKK